MYPPNTWCFDLEISNAIPEKGKWPEPGIRYCKHWGDHLGMGISCLVAARPDGKEVKVFTNDLTPNVAGQLPPLHLSHFWRLVQDADLLIGYGSRSFDAKVLAAVGLHIPDKKHLDFLFEIKRKLRNVAPKGYKLNDLSKRCNGPAKTEDGAHAPFLWQRGERLRVINYCTNDVQMLCAVANHYALTGGHVPSANYNTPLPLRSPQQIALED